MPVTHVPAPCAVYVRGEGGGRNQRFGFSHWARCTTPKLFPATLRTADLRAHDGSLNAAAAQRACFIVLVTGDVAQCVSVANVGEKNRVRFLYHGSSYSRPANTTPFAFPTELDDAYVPMCFHGTMAIFDHQHAFRTVVPLETGVALFPKTIRESDLPTLARWVDACATRSLHSSVWVTAGGDSYNELTRQCHPRTRQLRPAEVGQRVTQR